MERGKIRVVVADDHKVVRAGIRELLSDEPDIEACIEARADRLAGASLSQRLYRSTRLARRDTAVLVLVDISGSTDAWVAGQRRIIDVEREAMLPLSIALQSTGLISPSSSPKSRTCGPAAALGNSEKRASVSAAPVRSRTWTPST